MAHKPEQGPSAEPVRGPRARAERYRPVWPGEPGRHPFTRGVHGSTCTGRPWTTRQHMGSGTVVEAGARHRQLIANGATELSVAFDLPTRRGYDSDMPPARGEVGVAGVAVDSVDDMRVLFGGVPLDRVSTSLEICAPAAVLLLLYQLVGEEQGVVGTELAGAVHNDILEEYVAGGTGIFPPGPSLRLVADTLAYCRTEIPRWTAISVSGDRMARAGASPAEEVAFTLSNGIEYVRAAVAAGTAVDLVAPRLSFSFAARSTLLEEVATLRAARRIWARVMRERLAARDPRSWLLRSTARQYGADLVTATADPFTGSCVVESMTHDIESAAQQVMGAVRKSGGALAAIERGFWTRDTAQDFRAGETEHGGARRQAGTAGPVDPAVETRQAERIAKLRAWREDRRVRDGMNRMRTAATGAGNVLHPMKDALAAGATVGEVCDALREVWGTYTPADT
ncbi:methylmalonyl-CoA mutase family protein [Streptomyces sp. NPDC020681]|uniref:methylmalonyl-CoA mutase family protein n=1 Tax=Streptomyces sp. NPDC020681 TaxID=3365083 RepID=UPI0037934941